MSRQIAEMIIEKISQAEKEKDDGPKTELQRAALASSLIEKLQDLHNNHKFAIRELVTVKPSMGTRRIPGGIGIIVKVLSEPVVDEDAQASECYFREKLDVIVGCIGSDGIFREFHMNSQRLQPYIGPTTETMN